jgi:hypothetical protein
MHSNLDRREFLQKSSLAASAVALPSGLGLPDLDFLLPNFKQPKTRRVIVVAFAGGVRSKEVLGMPQNVPNLMRIASAGVTLPCARAANLGHYGAALSIFTGNTEAMSIRDNQRGLNPTLFEYLRKDAGLEQNDIWLSTSNGAQGRLFAYSDHPDYGAKYGANVLDSDGIFNKEFKDILDSFGRPHQDSKKVTDAMAKMAKAMDRDQLKNVEGKTRPDADQIRRVQDFILKELGGNNTRITGPGAGDAKAIRVAMSILTVFKPRVLGITLQNHDVAHGSFNSYQEVIRRNDAEIGKLWDSVQKDPELKETTAILITPEFGRDQNLNQRNGLDHGDRSDDLRRVFMIVAGPDFKKNKVVKKEVRTLDVCPTVMALFTKTKPKYATSSVIKEIFA